MTTWPVDRFDGLVQVAVLVGVTFFAGGIVVGFIDLIRRVIRAGLW